MNPEVITQNFTIIKGKPPLYKINLKCKSCNKLVVSDGGFYFSWDKFDSNSGDAIERLEVRAKYHLLIGCKAIKPNTIQADV